MAAPTRQQQRGFVCVDADTRGNVDCENGQGDSESEDDATDFESEFGNIEVFHNPRRDICDRCRRPVTVCWCAYLPRDPLDINTTIYILQHPFEESRPLKTAPMLQNSLAPGKCHVLQGKRFPYSKFPILEEVFSMPNTLLMFPGQQAEDLENVCTTAPPGTKFNLILLDGTWPQAKGIFYQNEKLHSLRQVQLSDTGLSEYVIRTQPTDMALSTLESAAIAISILEKKPALREIFLKPLRALCDFQLKYGAVKHKSKQFLMENGLYVKKINRKCMKKTS